MMHVGLALHMASWAATKDLNDCGSLYDLQRQTQKQFERPLNECSKERRKQIIAFANRAIEANYRQRIRA